MQAIFPRLHAYRQQALAAFSFGLALAQHCHLSRAALHLPTEAKPISTERRFQRLLANLRLTPLEAGQALLRWLASTWGAWPMLLVLDETPLSNRLRCLKVSLIYRGRAVPLMGVCYRPNALPKRMPLLAKELLQAVADALPASLRVVLMGDRGLSWPSLLDQTRALGWVPLFRLQKDVRVRLEDGSERTVGSLVESERVWTGTVEVFKDEGWRRGNLVAVAQPDGDPWLLLTDLPADRSICGIYRRRMQAEESFRDEKSAGFQWQQSRVSDPAHAERLLLAMGLAMLWLLSLGTAVRQDERRGLFEKQRGKKTRPKRRPHYSVFQLGARWLQHALLLGLPIDTSLSLVPPQYQALPP